MVSITKEDFPPPETPVTQVNVPSGILAVIFLRLLAWAPITLNLRFSEIGLLALGVSISRTPERYFPVRLAGDCIISSGKPSATVPPCFPAQVPYLEHSRRF